MTSLADRAHQLTGDSGRLEQHGVGGHGRFEVGGRLGRGTLLGVPAERQWGA
jgi:hypothetical protein